MPPTLRSRKRQPEASATALSTQPTTSPVSESTAVSAPSSNFKKRATRPPKNETKPGEMSSTPDEERPLLGGGPVPEVLDENRSWAQRNRWIVFALASGACAAFNGVFAKLTTTELTASFSSWIARMLGLESAEGVIEVVVRCSFFGLNLAFNGVMWTLFTTALARGNSTTQVSIMNTSCNFVITALLGYAIFSEALPPLWWLGAAMLVAGNVIIGRKDEGLAKEAEGDQEEGQAWGDGDGSGSPSGDGDGYGATARGGLPLEREAEEKGDEDVADLGI